VISALGFAVSHPFAIKNAKGSSEELAHKQAVRDLGEQPMIVVRLISGLGNQMFQYAAGRALSILKDTELLLDNAWYESIHANTPRQYELGNFNISARPLGSWLRACDLQLRRRRYAYLRVLLEALDVPFAPRHIIDIQNGFDDRLAKAGRNVYLDGYWQSECYFSGIRDTLLQEFTFRCAPDPVNSAMLESISQCNAVCIHVRRGDYLTTVNRGIHGLCGLDYYRTAIDYIRSRVSNPTFFIFSDDPQWVESKFPEVERMTAVTHNVGCQDSEDLRLMMNCRHFIIANSSFSWWAAWLGQCTDKIVVAPRRWAVSTKLSDNYRVPQGWIRF
jgi:hypothetical protein